jgi:hypothetical protein
MKCTCLAFSLLSPRQINKNARIAAAIKNPDAQSRRHMGHGTTPRVQEVKKVFLIYVSHISSISLYITLSVLGMRGTTKLPARITPAKK